MASAAPKSSQLPAWEAHENSPPPAFLKCFQVFAAFKGYLLIQLFFRINRIAQHFYHHRPKRWVLALAMAHGPFRVIRNAAVQDLLLSQHFPFLGDEGPEKRNPKNAQAAAAAARKMTDDPAQTFHKGVHKPVPLTVVLISVLIWQSFSAGP